MQICLLRKNIFMFTIIFKQYVSEILVLVCFFILSIETNFKHAGKYVSETSVGQRQHFHQGKWGQTRGGSNGDINFK
jgi:hypothetical protein